MKKLKLKLITNDEISYNTYKMSFLRLVTPNLVHDLLLNFFEQLFLLVKRLYKNAKNARETYTWYLSQILYTP